MINLLADKNIFHLEKFIPDSVHLSLFNPSEGLPEDLTSFDALFVRTVTKINETTLRDFGDRLKFIGTASSGTDHVDLSVLKKQGIRFADAAGCNARAVAEYIATSLLLWSNKYGEELTNLTVGVIGVGHVGSEVYKLLNELNIPTILYDPPRQEREPSFESSTLQEVLSADILTLHVPLTFEGPYATFHWLENDKLSKKYKMVINASRGGVVDEKALMDAFDNGLTEHIILDVWENEPKFNTLMAERAFIATPHVAGYSHQAKENATRMISETLSRFFQLENNENESPTDDDCKNYLFNGTELDFRQVIETINPILEYDTELRKIMRLDTDEKAAAFRELRTNKPYRLEYSSTGVPDWLCAQFPDLKTLGIHCNKTYIV